VAGCLAESLAAWLLFCREECFRHRYPRKDWLQPREVVYEYWHKENSLQRSGVPCPSHHDCRLRNLQAQIDKAMSQLSDKATLPFRGEFNLLSIGKTKEYLATWPRYSGSAKGFLHITKPEFAANMRGAPTEDARAILTSCDRKMKGEIWVGEACLSAVDQLKGESCLQPRTAT